MKAVALAALALLAFGAYVTTSATAASHPEFDTESGKTLLFTASGGTAILLGEQAKIVAEVNCEHSSAHGEILNKSPLVDNIGILFSGNCHETISGSSHTCTEPIATEPGRAEIGLALPATSPKTVGIYLIPYNSSSKWADPVCNGTDTEVLGGIIGTLPETSKYNTFAKTAEIKFADNGLNKQTPEEIDLLGVEMKGVHLETKGLFGGTASEIASGTITADGNIKILTNN